MSSSRRRPGRFDALHPSEGSYGEMARGAMPSRGIDMLDFSGYHVKGVYREKKIL